MFAYHADAAANQVLNILDSECRGVVQGIERAVLEFKWRFLGLPGPALAAGLDLLEAEGLLRPVGAMLRLTGAGYARLTDEAVAEVSPGAAPAEPGGGGGRPTEYGVRDKLLGVFRARGVDAGGGCRRPS